ISVAGSWVSIPSLSSAWRRSDRSRPVGWRSITACVWRSESEGRCVSWWRRLSPGGGSLSLGGESGRSLSSMLITIARQYGAGGSEVARRVAGALEWRVVDNELVEQVAARAGLQPEDVAELEERVPTFVERLARTLAAATPELFPAT